MLKNNPKILLYWGYKIINLFKQNTLNDGERYDPNIMNTFNINDLDQIERYNFSKNLIIKNENVLDIACGTGYGTLLLSEKCSQITGVDISKKSIEYANKHYKKSEKINFIQSDIFKFNGYADFVISFETIEHINEEIEKTVFKLLSLTKRKLICSVPYMELDGHNKHHVHFNINENTFDFLGNEYQKEILYQSSDGKIYKEKKDNTLSLIIIINKKII